MAYPRMAPIGVWLLFKMANNSGISVVPPYDFRLSLRAIRSFEPVPAEAVETLRLPARIAGTPTIIEIGSEGRGRIRVSATPAADDALLRQTAEWVLFGELDLKPFYRLTAGFPKLEELTGDLCGLKPTRPVSLFEMAVIAVTEQQISLAAAFRIRSRVVERFGEAIGDLYIFPEPVVLTGAPPEALRACGLSGQKTAYIRELARHVVSGELDFDKLKTMDDDSAREAIQGWRGFGRWSADYLLVRGLARPDCVSLDDLGVRSVVGEYLGGGERVSAAEAAEILEPFRPYRGLLAFYLLAAHRLNIKSAL